MFDIGFSELLVIGVVALVVIGPERLPSVARTVGNLLGRAQRYFNDIKADVKRELQLEDLRKLQAETEARLRSLEQEVAKEVSHVESSVDHLAAEVAAVKSEVAHDATATATKSAELPSGAQSQPHTPAQP